MMAVVLRAAASNVREAVLPDSGHSVMDKNPAFTVAIVSGFLHGKATP